MSEFPLTVLILFLLMVFPLINLSGLAVGAATECLIAHQCATRAAALQNYGSALAAMNDEAQRMFSSGFAAFAHLKPVGGYKGCGVELWTVVTNYHTGQVQNFGPNQPLTGGIDPSTYLYEFNAKVSCQVGPVINMSSLPWIGDVPGLGKPATLNFDAARAAEYPVGLTQSSAVASDPASPGGTLRNLSIPWDSTYAVGSPNGSSWNFPGLYDAIPGTGGTPLDDDVVLVMANDCYWTPTVFTVNPKANKVSTDIRVDGSWALANGVPISADGTVNAGAFGLPQGALIAKVGLGGTPFLIGTTQVGCSLPGGGGGGTLYLGMNSPTSLTDAPSPGAPTPANSPYAKFSGAQFVRVVTQN